MNLWFWCGLSVAREQHKKLSALEMELAAARQEGFTSMRSTEINGTDYKRRPLVVIGIFTTFGRKNNRDAIRKAWMGTGNALIFLWAHLFSVFVTVKFIFLFNVAHIWFGLVYKFLNDNRSCGMLCKVPVQCFSSSKRIEGYHFLFWRFFKVCMLIYRCCLEKNGEWKGNNRKICNWKKVYFSLYFFNSVMLHAKYTMIVG